jgi:hypothetical protein
MDEYRSVLLVVFSKNAPLERIAGAKGVVRLLIEYTTLDTKWDYLYDTIYQGQWSFYTFSSRSSVLDHFLERIRDYPNISSIQTETTTLLLEYCCRHRHDELYLEANKFDYLRSIMPRLFDAFKSVVDLKDHPLAQAVFKTYGKLHGDNRFAYRELGNMNMKELNQTGVEILSVRADFKHIKAGLRTTRNERVDVDVILHGKYPIDAPSFHFVGKLRPTFYTGRDHVFMPVQFARMYDNIEGIEGCLRFILIHMEYGGVDKI